MVCQNLVLARHYYSVSRIMTWIHPRLVLLVKPGKYPLFLAFSLQNCPSFVLYSYSLSFPVGTFLKLFSYRVEQCFHILSEVKTAYKAQGQLGKSYYSSVNNFEYFAEHSQEGLLLILIEVFAEQLVSFETNIGLWSYCDGS